MLAHRSLVFATPWAEGAGVDQSAIFDDVAEPVSVSKLGDMGFGLTIKNQHIGKIIGFDATQFLPA